MRQWVQFLVYEGEREIQKSDRELYIHRRVEGDVKDGGRKLE
jgi:hypothetical protein